MSAIANIAIQDGQATPVTHTFYPVQTAPDAILRENQASLPVIGQGAVKTQIKIASSADGLNKVTVTMDLPALETATGNNASGYTAAPKVAYSNRVVSVFYLPNRGTLAQRKDLRVLLRNLLADAQIVDVIDNLNVPY